MPTRYLLSDQCMCWVRLGWGGLAKYRIPTERATAVYGCYIGDKYNFPAARVPDERATGVDCSSETAVERDLLLVYTYNGTLTRSMIHHEREGNFVLLFVVVLASLLCLVAIGNVAVFSLELMVVYIVGVSL